MNSFRIFVPFLAGLLTLLPIGRLAGGPKAVDRTAVDHVTKRPRFNSQGLGTAKYVPSDREQPFFAKLDAAERETGGLAGDYKLSGKDGVYVGWFGIVRDISDDKVTGRSTLVVEHKYFDGFTDSHIQALSFNGSGDFLATLPDAGHRIRQLTLVKVYGKVSKGADGGPPRIDAAFIRNWHWGTFTFLAAHGTQRGSEKWRKLNQVKLKEIYDPYPDDAYYKKRLGERSDDAERRQMYRRLALGAAKEAATDVLSGNKPSKRVDSQAFRALARRAAKALPGAVGSAVEPLIDAIVKEDTVAVSDALKAMTRIRAERTSVAVLVEALRHEEDGIRSLAATELAELGFAARTAVPALVAALKDENLFVRNYAATALGNIGPEAQYAVPALIVALGDDASYVRSNASEALGKINAQAKYVVPALVLALEDANGNVRWDTVAALGEFKTAAAEAAAPLREALLHDIDGSVRWNTARALAAVDSEGRIAIPALIEAMKGKDPAVRRFAAMGLGEIGPKARAAVPLLRKSLKDDDVGARVAAAEALWKVDRNAKAAVPVLIQVLEQNEGLFAAYWAADALATVGPEAKQAIGALRKMLGSTSGRWRSYAMHALGNIGPEASVAVPDLVELLGGKDGEIRAYAAGALWKINRHALAIPTLIKELRNPPDDNPYYAVISLGEIGPPARKSIPDLIKTLSHRKLYVRKEAAIALEKIDPKSLPKSADK